MSKLDEINRVRQIEQAQSVEAEVGELVPMGKPDHIPHDVWEMILENGRIATERLNEILTSPRFHRLRASDQVKLIKIAQDRAYGAVQTPKDEKNKGKFIDVTAEEMNKLEKRALLPEYRNERKPE